MAVCHNCNTELEGKKYGYVGDHPICEDCQASLPLPPENPEWAGKRIAQVGEVVAYRLTDADIREYQATCIASSIPPVPHKVGDVVHLYVTRALSPTQITGNLEGQPHLLSKASVSLGTTPGTFAFITPDEGGADL